MTLCTGKKSASHHYEGTQIFRIVTDDIMIGGDTEKNDGSGGISIYEKDDEIYNKDGLFYDENIWFPHSHKGTISMY